MEGGDREKEKERKARKLKQGVKTGRGGPVNEILMLNN